MEKIKSINKTENISLNEENPLSEVKDFFDPQKELRSILSIEPGVEKDVALDIFKLRLSEQAKGLSLLKEEIVNVSKSSTLDDLTKIVAGVFNTYKEKYKFYPEQESIIKKMINEFVGRRFAVDSFFKDHNGDPVAMYKDIYGIEPQGVVEVKRGQISISFICEDLIDYSRIYNSDYSGAHHELIESGKIERANISGGIFLNTTPESHPELKNAIIGIKNGPEWKQEFTIKHEEQHAINRIYSNNISSNEFSIVNTELSLMEGDHIKDKTIKLCKSLLDKALDNVKDEIIAYKIEGLYGDEDIMEILLMDEQEGGMYDYMQRELFLFKIESALEKENIDDDSILKSAQDILIKDYENFIKDGLEVFDLLKKGGVSEEAIVSMLMPEKLSNWKKVARRAIK